MSGMENEILSNHEFSSTGLGLKAFQSLKNHHFWEVWGNTSKGVFLKGKLNGLIFLSNEKFRGPLTINFPATVVDYFDGIEIGSKVNYRTEEVLYFELLNVKLIVDDQHPWEPGPFTTSQEDLGIWNNLDQLGDWLISATPIGSFAHTSALIGFGIEPDGNENIRLFQILREMYKVLSESNSQRFQLVAQNLIGLGAGLTPSGDDFLSGMALGNARFSKTIPILSKYMPWFEALIPTFEEKTTLLSSELYKVSLIGSADERIIGAFDSVMLKKIAKDEVIIPIANWGSSSGFDMMSGLFLLLKANQP
jgi:hypothetical protein